MTLAILQRSGPRLVQRELGAAARRGRLGFLRVHLEVRRLAQLRVRQIHTFCLRTHFAAHAGTFDEESHDRLIAKRIGTTYDANRAGDSLRVATMRGPACRHVPTTTTCGSPADMAYCFVRPFDRPEMMLDVFAVRAEKHKRCRS